MNKFIVILSLILTHIGAFAQYADRGRPTDMPGHSDGGGYLEGIFIFIAVIVILAIGGFWLYDKIQKNKKSIADAGGTIFAALLIFGGMLLVGWCGESIKKSNKSEKSEAYEELIDSKNENKTINKVAPTLKYRYVDYYESCFSCNGNGKIICNQCGGSGSYTQRCHICNGTGRYNERCRWCDGQGYTKNNLLNTSDRCYICDGYGYEIKSCFNCQGEGLEEKICSFDSWANHNIHYVDCSSCNGLGSIKRTRQESYYD